MRRAIVLALVALPLAAGGAGSAAAKRLDTPANLEALLECSADAGYWASTPDYAVDGSGRLEAGAVAPEGAVPRVLPFGEHEIPAGAWEQVALADDEAVFVARSHGLVEVVTVLRRYDGGWLTSNQLHCGSAFDEP